MEDYEFSRE
jgi:cysteinyl-tRNA synthetase